ncbi:MAG TPA: 50S ribosomal protein L10 [Candidatus Woesebacteria bacterium]|nr:50S ribosomal protein L10 [Candidatus Woesebacteria bacterium]HOY61315.1 50S ribosomal protein L10 [Candidatus Woesebacteria bacterium]HPR99491.1 50S ribosomal protein L10 [Candidatus Woesebacteria bacterium]
MPKIQKIEKVDQIVAKLSESKSAALIQYQGLSAGDISNLRANIKKAGGSMEVIKNSLISRALNKIGLSLPETLTGPTAIAYCDTDEIAPLKEIDIVNKDKEKTFFKYGIYNKKLLSLEELKKFISLPSKSALVAQFIGGLKNPLQRLIYAMRFNQQQLVLTLKALSDKKATETN